MPVAGGGFEQCYNAQAVVAAGSLLVVAPTWCRRPTTSSSRADAGQARGLCRTRGPVTLLADNGYFSEANVQACAPARSIH